MNSLPTITSASSDDKTPLPLIVAEKWNFPLAHAQADNGVFYHIQDWIVGLTGTETPRRVLSDLKRGLQKNQKYVSTVQLPYKARDGKSYQMEYTDDKGLYIITMSLRVTKERAVLAEIKRYLAESGAFVDLIRRVPETVVTSGAIDPETAMDAVIEAYRRQGKDDRWISARLAGKVKRVKFTAALQAAVYELLTEKHYAIATDDIYLGLWLRTSAKIKQELALAKTANLRDNQPTLALIYQGLAEEVAAQKLGDRTELTWNDARAIIKRVAELIGVQAQATSQFLGVDLATGKPLLTR